ncbi:hypothetical protein PHJA_002864300 [Phtheirospermum japonicum]|uniref:Uncharacterized protein n=1 Tax=Phtheirospermum japonicum TaxID=374723 RepID=A0A830DN34_9LAMI|nr:hypothetical protein PHJA_002864300 [Phtheirospermum japonicum]
MKVSKCRCIIRCTRDRTMRRWRSGSWTFFFGNTGLVLMAVWRRRGFLPWGHFCGLINISASVYYLYVGFIPQFMD